MADARTPPGDQSLEDDLVAWGKTIRIETRGRRTGRVRQATIGFVEESDGSLVVAASSHDTHWARNLSAEPRCAVERADGRRDFVASALQGSAANEAVASLILKYGTPAERLGAGPAFRLVPRNDGD